MLSLGATTVVSRTGHTILRTKSRLPGGGLAQSANQNATCCTLLDCIMLQPDQAEVMDTQEEVLPQLTEFGVLDLIRFRKTSYTDLPFRERCPWLEEYLLEQIEEHSDKDPVRFKVLPSVSCEVESLQKTLSEKPPFPLDGILFYHEDVLYRAGATPLVGWLKPYMLMEWFPEVHLHADYVLDTPPEYNDYRNEIRQQEDRSAQSPLSSTKVTEYLS